MHTWKGGVGGRGTGKYRTPSAKFQNNLYNKRVVIRFSLLLYYYFITYYLLLSIRVQSFELWVVVVVSYVFGRQAVKIGRHVD
jgi:hypothetical protein